MTPLSTDLPLLPTVLPGSRQRFSFVGGAKALISSAEQAWPVVGPTCAVRMACLCGQASLPCRLPHPPVMVKTQHIL